MTDERDDANARAARAFLAEIIAVHERLDAQDDQPPEFELDERTGWLLGSCDIDAEVPDGAMATYKQWVAAVEAGDPGAVATYERLRPGPQSEIEHVTFIADRIDDRDPAVEREIVDAIFGARYGKPVHELMRDEFMRRRDEAEHAVERLRLRLEGSCATPTDAARVAWCAEMTVTEEMLQAFSEWLPGQEIEGFVVGPCEVKVADGRLECTFTETAIQPGERYVSCQVPGFYDEITVQAASKSAAWCHHVLGDVELALRLAVGADTNS